MTKPLHPQRVLIPLGLGTVVSIMGDATLYTVLPNPEISAQVGITTAMVGYILSANRATRLLINGPVGRLYDRLPRRPLMVFALFLGSAVSILYATGTGFTPLIIGRVLWGIAWSLLFIGGNSMVLDISDDTNRGRYTGQYQMWFFIGVAFASFMAGFLTDQFGFRGGLWISTSVTALVAVGWLLFLPETRSTLKSSSAGTRHAVSAAETSAIKPKESQPFPLWATVTAALPLFSTRFVFAGVMAVTTILWLEGLFGGSGLTFADGRTIALPTLTGSLVAMQGTVSLISAVIIGRLSDRIGRRWGIIAPGLLVCAIGLGIMSLNRIPISLLGIFFAGMMNGGINALVPATVGDQLDPSQVGRALGIVYVIGDLGSTLGPFVLIILGRGLLTLPTVYQFCAVLFLLIMVIAGVQAIREGRISHNTNEGVSQQ